MAQLTTKTGWPKLVEVKNAELELRPMTADDGAALLKFFRRLPADDRLYLKEDVTSPEVIDRWVRNLDYGRVLPVLAWDRDRIVGDGTLHRSRVAARQHIGELRVVMDPEYRNRGVGRTLLQTLVNVARAEDSSLETLVFEVVPDAEPAAVHTAEAIGFVQAATFSAHIRYFDGTPHDLHIYELRFTDEVEVADPAAYMY